MYIGKAGFSKCFQARWFTIFTKKVINHCSLLVHDDACTRFPGTIMCFKLSGGELKRSFEKRDETFRRNDSAFMLFRISSLKTGWWKLNNVHLRILLDCRRARKRLPENEGNLKISLCHKSWLITRLFTIFISDENSLLDFILVSLTQSIQPAIINSFECNCEVKGLQDVTGE